MLGRIKRVGAALGAVALLAGGAVAVAAPAEAGPNRNISIDLNAACDWQYSPYHWVGFENAKWYDGNNPGSWYCQDKGLPYKNRGGLDLNAYCKNFYGTNAYLSYYSIWGWRCA